MKKKQKSKPQPHQLKAPSQKSNEVMTGTLKLHARGFGFVIPDHPIDYPEDIFIPKPFTNHAVDGDSVEVEVEPEARSDKGPEGKIIAILKRGRTHLGGTVFNLTSSPKALVYAPLLGKEKLVEVDREDLIEGDRVILKINEWGSDTHPTRGEVAHRLGHISDPSIDNQAAIEEFDLADSFSKKAIEQAQKWGSEVTKKELAGRVDFTKITSLTIDPDTAKDFDDALSVRKLKTGGYELIVHIADVAHYIPALSPLDLEARERCNSTYFPGFCLPMLPHELSSHLASLMPEVKRLTVSVVMQLSPEGDIVSSEVVRSVIESSKRFTYEEAKRVLDKKEKSPYLKELELLAEVCHLFKKKRSERGSIDFALHELVILVDKEGRPTGTKTVEYDITHQLVEECMLKANEIVAKTLTGRGKNALFRVHEAPTDENMEEFYTLVRSLGFSLPAKPTPFDLQAVFKTASSSSAIDLLSVSFIRSMKLATYSDDNIGHFGLALTHYSHFTSPIRRYTDLVIQRLLFDEEDKEANLKLIAAACSDAERVSSKAEASVKSLKKFRLLQKWMQEDPEKYYEARVSKVKPFGLFFEVLELALDGFLHISELENDYFIFDPKRSILVGKSSGKTHALGDKFTVKPSSLDLILLESKWELLDKRKRKR